MRSGFYALRFIVQCVCGKTLFAKLVISMRSMRSMRGISGEAHSICVVTAMHDVPAAHAGWPRAESISEKESRKSKENKFQAF